MKRFCLALISILCFCSGAPMKVINMERTLVRTSCADPCIVYDRGYFYLTMTGATRIAMVKDASITRLGTRVHPTLDNIIYDSSMDRTVGKLFGRYSELSGTWSPELHFFSEEEFPGQSGWYMYFSIREKVEDNGTGGSRNIRMVVLKSATGLLDGPWVHPVTGKLGQSQPILDPKGKVIDRWAVGPSVLRVPSGEHKGTYLMWVEEQGRGEGKGKFFQKIMISNFSSPWQLSGEPGLITTPTQNWEFIGSTEKHPRVVEGATAVYGDHGEVFLTYSGSGYWSNYGLGQLTLLREGEDSYADPLQTSSWVKYEGNPVFSSAKSSDLRGAGHAFFLSDASGGRFLCYHAYPVVDGKKAKTRNAYIEPYYIDYDAACPSAPYGVLRIGLLGTGVTAPVSSSISFVVQ